MVMELVVLKTANGIKNSELPPVSLAGDRLKI